MSCYFIANITIHDKDEYKKYVDKVDAVFAKFNGEYLAFDDNPVVLEGKWPYKRAVVIRFPSEEECRRWYDSPEYQEILKHRLKAADCTTILVRDTKG
ncbi:MAG: DUF1330 domain-containing protein [Bacillota bacterium]